MEYYEQIANLAFQDEMEKIAGLKEYLLRAGQGLKKKLINKLEKKFFAEIEETARGITKAESRKHKQKLKKLKYLYGVK